MAPLDNALSQSEIFVEYEGFEGDSEGRYTPEYSAELAASVAAYEADKKRGISRGTPLAQVIKELGLDNNN
ncbi:MAG: hypothetical protein QM537_00640 [Candidatus Symbiobacter sp.]|nr:hypothetical protein [Candidatus Symbiobacter sp.]